MRKGLAGILAILLALVAVYGCTKTESKKENLMENSNFSAWADDTHLPAGWKIEGSGLTVKKSNATVEGAGTTALECAFTPDPGTINSPFVYWQAKDPKRFWGKNIAVGAWVKTSVANMVAVELSNRGGVDSKSSMQPGNGQWQYLSVSWKVPENTPTIEVRVRFYAPGTAFFASPAITEESAI